MNTNERLKIDHINDEDDVTTVSLAGDLDIQTAPLLRNFMESVVTGKTVNLRLDLSRLSYLDSSGFIALVDATRRNRLAKSHVDLTNMPPWITDFFDMSALEP
jgi:anti-sigma B factor antagonist